MGKPPVISASEDLARTRFSARTQVSWLSLAHDGHVQELGPPWPAVEFGRVLGEVQDVDRPHDGCPRLDVVILRGHARSASNPLRIAKAQFETLLKTLKLPASVIRHMHSNNGELSLVPEYNDHSDGGIMTHMCVLISSPEAEVNRFTLSLRLSLSTGNASGILIVEAEKQLCGLREDIAASISKLRASPLYFLTVLLDRYAHRNEARREQLDNRLVELEDRMGLSPFVGGRSSGGLEGIESEEGVINELHDNNTRLIWLSGTVNFEIMAVEFVTGLLDRLGPSGVVLPPAISAIMMEELRGLKASAELRQFQRKNLQLRAETRIAMLYARISQRDSRVSIDVAEQSHKISETMGQDSRMVRSIAVVSFLFLPATFVAAIFSTGLFDFQQDSLVVSRYWWVFVFLTTVLTALIVLGWALLRLSGGGWLRDVQTSVGRSVRLRTKFKV